MFEQVKGVLASEPGEGRESLEKALRRLTRRIDALEQEQQRMMQALNETRARSGFKEIQLDRKIAWLYDKVADIDDVEQHLADVAIEEKVDASRLENEIRSLRTDTADTGAVQERLQDIQEHTEQRQDALKEDITMIDAAVHATVEELRQDLVNSFHRELTALETMIAYDIDAVEAERRWERDDLADRIDALHTTLEEDITDLEAKTLARIRTRTVELENRLERQSRDLEDVRDSLQEQMDDRMDRLKRAVQAQIGALEDADMIDIDDLMEEQADIDRMKDNLQMVRERLETQADRIDTTREQLEQELDDALDTVIEQDVEPLQDAVQTVRRELDTHVDTYTEEVADLRDDIDTALDTIDDVDTELDTVQDRIQELAEEEDVDALQEHVTRIQDTLEETAAEDDLEQLQHQVSTLRDSILEIDDRKADIDTVNTLDDQVMELDAEKADTTAVNQLQDYIGRIRERIGMIDERKADRGKTTDRLNQLQADIGGLKHDLEEAQNTLNDRLTDLEESAADADTVDDLDDELIALKDAVAHKDAIREALRIIRGELSEIQDAAVSQDDMDFVERRVQTMREQIGDENLRNEFKTRLQRLEQLEHRAEETIAEQESFQTVSRQEFEELHRDVRVLYKKLNDLSRQTHDQG